jgi:predicted O-methyltransferase YrrM
MIGRWRGSRIGDAGVPRSVRLARVGQRLWWLVRNPIENATRVGERFETRRPGWRPEAVYAPEDSWEARLHQILGAPWPCSERLEVEAVFRDSIEFVSSQGLKVGRGAYGGWDDADLALVRVAWCLARHVHPQRVVETGVGRGVTSRVILEALERNGTGQLWSVDQPPPLSPRLKRQAGAAVPVDLRKRWRYVRGSSRRRLPRVVDELGELDLFIHDSMHSTRNVLFELKSVWPALRPGGVMLVGDINMNRGFEFFTGDHTRDHERVVGSSDDGNEMIGVIQKASLAAA